MIDSTKSEKQEFRSLVDYAYKIKMTLELEKLELAHASWRKGNINVFELDDQIHKYYSGPRKNLYKSYVLQPLPETMVARGLALGLIGRERLSAAVEKKIEHLVQFFKENK